MPELPEVETVRAGLFPVMNGYTFEQVHLARPDLRFPFADNFAARLSGAKINHLSRRAKFLMAELSTGETLLMHLGMSGRFTITPNAAHPKAHTLAPGLFTHETGGSEKHDHVTFEMSSGARIIYNDPRRFGFMELFEAGADIERLSHLGPEPLGNQFNGPQLHAALEGKGASIKAALLDQRVVAGLGNIYVCEALYRAGIHPARKAGQISTARIDVLAGHIRQVLQEAIAAGGSTLKDFASASGDLGYFQHSFDVYGREGEPCKACGKPLTRIVQSSRSTFYCKACQS